MKTELMIEAQGLQKRFGSTVALDGLDLQVPAGAILGVLGPNGAGKTTAVRILTTLSKPDGGSARVRASARRRPLSRPTMTRFCRPDSTSSRVASWAVTPISA